MPAALAPLIIGMTVFESLGTMTMPSTLRLTKFLTCSSCRLASPSATASSIRMLRRLHSARSWSQAATQLSVCRVSKATPIVSAPPPPPPPGAGVPAALVAGAGEGDSDDGPQPAKARARPARAAANAAIRRAEGRGGFMGVDWGAAAVP
jgi:hypothetical protein